MSISQIIMWPWNGVGVGGGRGWNAPSQQVFLQFTSLILNLLFQDWLIWLLCVCIYMSHAHLVEFPIIPMPGLSLQYLATLVTPLLKADFTFKCQQSSRDTIPQSSKFISAMMTIQNTKDNKNFIFASPTLAPSRWLGVSHLDFVGPLFLVVFQS